jgi:hypothetical protein
MFQTPGNDLVLGRMPGSDEPLRFTRKMRDKHLYICGSTGTGKSKFLEHLIRQDIVAWRESKCGMLVMDPHGTLYDSLMNWLSWNRIERPIIPIDLRQDSWVVSYNLLRQRQLTDPSVLVDNLTNAMAYVWGQGGVDKTPLFARWAGNVIRTLYQKKLTFVEAEHLLDRVEKQIRYALTSDLTDKLDQQDWRLADTLSPREFESQIGSTVNRLQRFLRNQTMRSMFGQPEVSLDLGKALEEGSIILVSLATERAKVSVENRELFATLLLSDLWTAAQERGKRDGVKPFYVYLDEFQRFVSPTISDSLDEARGYGLHLTMAHQFPNQLLDRGENGRQVYNSIMENASSKVVFRLSHEDNLRAMAQWLFMGVMDPDQIKHELFSTKVMAYREEMREVSSESQSSTRGSTTQRGHSSGVGSGGSETFPFDHVTGIPLSTTESWTSTSTDSNSESDSASEATSRSKSYVPSLIPVLGKELAHVQFRSLDEQLHRAMAVLFDQEERHGVARLAGMRAPVSITTPNIPELPRSPDRSQRFVEKLYDKLSFAMKGEDARKRVLQRAEAFSAALVADALKEPSLPDDQAFHKYSSVPLTVIDPPSLVHIGLLHLVG